jgi:hypothetical protein
MEMIDNLTQIISRHLSVGKESKIKTNSIEVEYKRSNALNLSNQLDLDGSKIQMPPVCDILKSDTSPSCEGKIVTRQVNKYFSK